MQAPSGHRCTPVVAVIVLTLMATSVISVHASSPRPFTATVAPFGEGDFLEYVLRTQLIVLWNYTLDNGTITTHDDERSRTIVHTPALTNEISIRVEALSKSVSGTVTIVISYLATPVTGYRLNHSVLVSYHPESGACTIENGTLEGQTGVLSLFSSDQWPQGEFVISSLARNVTAELAEIDDPYNVMGQYQLCLNYLCEYHDSVDGQVSHRRFYDRDSKVLVGAEFTGGIADRVLLGLANISYADYELELVDTNIDLGTEYSYYTAAVSRIIVTAVFLVFLFTIIGVWRRRSKAQRMTEDTQGEEFGFPQTERAQWYGVAHMIPRETAKAIAIALTVMVILGPLMMLRYELEVPGEPNEIQLLYESPVEWVTLNLDEWLYCEFYFPAPPSGKMNSIHLRAFILDWGVCPVPLLLEYKFSTAPLQGFLAMNETEREQLILNGVYFQDKSRPTSGSIGFGTWSAGYRSWCGRITAPYHNGTQGTLSVFYNVSLEVVDPK